MSEYFRRVVIKCFLTTSVITEPEEVGMILRHLIKIGRSPPGLDQSFM